MRLPGLHRLIAHAGAPLARLRSRRQIRHAWPAAPPPLHPRVALLCHHDPRGTLRPDLLRYARELRDAGFSAVLVSNSGALRPEALAAARAACDAVLVRRNRGWDFCAWCDAMEHLALPRGDTDQILLANDSVYGPLRPLAPLLARMQGPGLWGMTDSAERGFHLQSYFLLAQRDVLHSDAWRRFWRGVRPLHSKWLVIGRYEVGLTQRMLRAGFACRALFPGNGDARSNPMLENWRDLLHAGLPFIKRALLRDNPTAAAGLDAWRSVAAEIAGVETVRAIEHDLALTRHG